MRGVYDGDVVWASLFREAFFQTTLCAFFFLFDVLCGRCGETEKNPGMFKKWCVMVIITLEVMLEMVVLSVEWQRSLVPRLNHFTQMEE